MAGFPSDDNGGDLSGSVAAQLVLLQHLKSGLGRGRVGVPHTKGRAISCVASNCLVGAVLYFLRRLLISRLFGVGKILSHRFHFFLLLSTAFFFRNANPARRLQSRQKKRRSRRLQIQIKNPSKLRSWILISTRCRTGLTVPKLSECKPWCSYVCLKNERILSHQLNLLFLC